MAEPVVLSAEAHFGTLREAVWVRYCARHRGSDRDRFDDLYSEWWAREVERAAKGSPSRATAPAAFVAEAVHRVLIDDVRARARGLAREDKGSLEIVELEGQLDAAALDDTAEAAGYEALAHRILTLVRGSLSERELRVFVWSYLYLQTSERTAEALGLSLPRVKKDRKRIAGKIGARVWDVLGSELDLCEAYREQSLTAIFEILTVHVEDCATCASSLGKVRRGALVVIGPEMLVLGTATTEGATHVLTDLLHAAAARMQSLLHRGTETLAAIPPNGRTAAAVAVAATAVAGGAATVVPEVAREDRAADARRKAEVQPPRPRATPIAVPTAIATTPPPPIIQPRVRPTATASAARTTRARASRTPVATAAAVTTAAAVQEEITFEQQAAPAAPPPSPSSPSGGGGGTTRSSTPPAQEFGFEGP